MRLFPSVPLLVKQNFVWVSAAQSYQTLTPIKQGDLLIQFNSILLFTLYKIFTFYIIR